MNSRRVKIFNIAGAIYLGVYMILPGCLCQVLSVFGVALHDLELPPNVCVISADSNLPCHCDHADSKKAELAHSPHVDCEAEHFIVVPLAAEFTICLADSDPDEFVRSRAPPPPCQSVSRVFTGVFLV